MTGRTEYQGQSSMAEFGAAQLDWKTQYKLIQMLELGRKPYHLIIGEVVYFHYHDGIVNEKVYVDVGKVNPIGWLAGRGGYTRITDRFEMPRIKYGGVGSGD